MKKLFAFLFLTFLLIPFSAEALVQSSSSGTPWVFLQKPYYKRFVYIGYGDNGPSSPVELGGHRVDHLNNLSSADCLFDFGMCFRFQTPASTNSDAGAGYAPGGIPANDFFSRGTHFFWRPTVFSAAFVLRNVANTAFLCQLGDTLYDPDTIETAAGIASPGGNSIAIYYNSADLEFRAINRGTAAANRVSTDLNLVAQAETPYVIVISLDKTSVSFGIYNTTGVLLSSFVTQSFASDFVTTKPSSGTVFSGTNVISYPKCFIKTKINSAAAIGMFWYYFDDYFMDIPNTLVLGR